MSSGRGSGDLALCGPGKPTPFTAVLGRLRTGGAIWRGPPTWPLHGANAEARARYRRRSVLLLLARAIAPAAVRRLRAGSECCFLRSCLQPSDRS